MTLENILGKSEKGKRVLSNNTLANRTFGSQGISQPIIDYADRLVRQADLSESKGIKLAAYAAATTICATYLCTEAGARALEALLTIPAKAGTAFAVAKPKVALATTLAFAGVTGTLYHRHTQQSAIEYSAQLPVVEYKISDDDVRIHKGDIWYSLLEDRFGYTVKQNGEYIKLRETRHHPSIHGYERDTFSKAFRRLNPDLTRKLEEREDKARRNGDSIYHHLRPGDTIRFYSAKTK